MIRNLIGGTCYNIIICKDDLEKYNLDLSTVVMELDKKIDMTFYDKKESEKIILYTLKDEVILECMEEFIKNQLKFYDLAKDEIQPLINKLHDMDDVSELIRVAKSNEFNNLTYDSVLEHLIVDGECDIRICYECISFFREEYIEKEDKHFLSYIEKLIRKSARYNKLGSTVRVFFG